jgi:hypothetical protein
MPFDKHSCSMTLFSYQFGVHDVVFTGNTHTAPSETATWNIGGASVSNRVVDTGSRALPQPNTKTIQLEVSGAPAGMRGH